MRALVTGGAGFIGSHLVRALVARGDAVRVLDDLSTGDRDRLSGLDVDLHVGDVRDGAAVAEATADVDAVFHQAAIASVPRSVREPLETASVNVAGTVRVLAAASRRQTPPRVIVASSSAVYGAGGAGRLAEDAPLAPTSPYAASKAAAEAFVASFARVASLPTLALRYFNVYGEGQDPASDDAPVVARFAACLHSGRTPVVFGDGEQTRDFCHVDDVVEANLAALGAPAPAWGRVFNVGTGRATSLNALVRLLGRHGARDFAPRHLAARVADVRHSCADIERSREVLGFAARIGLEEGLTEVVGRGPD